MKRREIVKIFGGTVIASALSPRELLAHGVSHHHWHPPILPHVRPRPRHPQPVQVNSIDVVVKIVGRLATTTMTMVLHNPGHRQQESEVIIPVSSKAVNKIGLAPCGE